MAIIPSEILLSMTRERGSTIQRVLSLVSFMAQTEQSVGLQAISQTLNVPKSTAHRLCSVLESQGYLQKDYDGRKYVPGPAMREIAMGVLSGAAFHLERHAILQGLSEDLGETCNLAYPDGSSMVYADRVETKWPLRLQFPVGSKVPLHCTASGKMYLATLDDKRQRKLLSLLPWKCCTSLTITDPMKLLQELAEVKANDFATDRGELVEGMIAVAVPIRDQSRGVVGTVSVQAPEIRMSLKIAIGHVARLRQAAMRFAELLRAG